MPTLPLSSRPIQLGRQRSRKKMALRQLENLSVLETMHAALAGNGCPRVSVQHWRRSAGLTQVAAGESRGADPRGAADGLVVVHLPSIHVRRSRAV